jgi:prepilin-type N-terminal cleavage/methylation domain-containing protein
MNKHIHGYTMVELLLAVVVSSIILAGTYASYMIVSDQYQRNEGASQIHSFAIPTLKILTRDLRMAGFRNLDGDIEATLGAIATPITITDSGDDCCDTVTVVMDTDDSTRKRFTYYVDERENPNRLALFLDIEVFDTGTWVAERTAEVVADYIEDFQVVGSENNSSGFPTLLDISLVFRTKTLGKEPLTFSKPAYSFGNYDYEFNDNFARREFSTTILLRNLLHKTY